MDSLFARIRMAFGIALGNCLLSAGLFFLSAAPALAQKTTANKPVVKDIDLAASHVDLEKFPAGWTFYTAEPDSPLNQTWKIVTTEGEKERVLQCLGKPYGYLKTTKTYTDFEISLEWKFPKNANGNSGILIHTAADDKIWPKSIQVQLHGPTTGSIFPLGEAMSETKIHRKDQMPTANEWHRCSVRSFQGKISVTIDDKKVGEITGCNPTAGSISLQSEGSEIHFRRIVIRELDPAKETNAVSEKSDIRKRS